MIPNISGFLIVNLFYSIPGLEAQPTSVMPTAPGSFSQLAKKVSPSVVNISATKVFKGGIKREPLPYGQDDPFREFFDRFFSFYVIRDI